mmetsp:Transcript_3061/g.8484  ORF Transcript_3061/g.8484 Transcript_3061/m.8484 type:complete len:214 (+) Transcript_3061:241-882(+)
MLQPSTSCIRPSTAAATVLRQPGCTFAYRPGAASSAPAPATALRTSTSQASLQAAASAPSPPPCWTPATSSWSTVLSAEEVSSTGPLRVPLGARPGPSVRAPGAAKRLGRSRRRSGATGPAGSESRLRHTSRGSTRNSSASRSSSNCRSGGAASSAQARKPTSWRTPSMRSGFSVYRAARSQLSSQRVSRSVSPAFLASWGCTLSMCSFTLTR